MSDILLKYAGKRKIDFMSIDTEGSDFDVLMGNDWKTFRPKIICIEVAERMMK